MNNNRGMMTSLFTVGAASAIIYGVTRGIRNGTFQRWQQTISNVVKNPQTQPIMQPLQNTVNQQSTEQVTSSLQNTLDND